MSDLGRPRTRRRCLTLVGIGVMLAGCLADGDDEELDDSDDSNGVGDTDDAADADDRDGTDAVDMDDVEDDGDATDDSDDTDDADVSDDEPPADAVEPAVETVVDGLDRPWGLAFLSDPSYLLVTEREGRLQLINLENGSMEDVTGLPDIHAAGQGGLLDVAVEDNDDGDPTVYITYVATNDEGLSSTHLARAGLNTDDPALIDLEELYAVEPFKESNGHFGSRVVVGPDDHLYLSTGDRQDKDFSEDHPSQNVENGWGSVLRLATDGSVPEDNPFVDEGDAEPAIFSYGHRNVQGMTVNPETDSIWITDHGEQDGDEINILEAGGNFGWPIAHHGCTYGDGEPIGEEPEELDEVIDPVFYWPCNSGGFPPSGMWFYRGDAFPAWQGNLFVGNLAGQYLGRFAVDGDEVEELDPLLADQGWRIRAVTEAPDTGELYVLVDDTNAPLVRIVPE